MPNNTYQTVYNPTLNALPKNERGYYKLSQIAAPNRQSVGEPYFRVLNVVANSVSPSMGNPWTTANISNIQFSGQETPIGIINGVNQNFTLAHGNVVPSTLTIIINDSPILAYTLSGGSNQNIAFSIAPANNSVIFTYYAYGTQN